jgi:hypothetical protein
MSTAWAAPDMPRRRVIVALIAIGVVAVIAANAHLVLVATSSDSGCVGETKVVEDGAVTRRLAPAKPAC